MNKEYLDIVSDILDNESFKKLSGEIHHHGSRIDHSIRVSYKTYKVCKRLGLDYISASRASLLHDYFFNEEFDSNSKLYKLTHHYERAIANASNLFNLNDMEKNIICSHMFPIGGKAPKYLESIIVDIIDDVSAIYEVLSCKYYFFKYSFLCLAVSFYIFR